MNSPEISEELLRLEYPSLLPDHDPDIERYYYLRSRGYAREAMVIYQSRLKSRYPNDNFRTILMRCYRSRDPAYHKLLILGYQALAERCLERVKRSIRYIAEKADSYNEKDAYSTIKAAEDILILFPGDRYEAMAGIDRYLRYAQNLNFCLPSMLRAANLIHAYLSQSLSVVDEERNRREEARQRARTEELQRLVQADWENYSRQKNAPRGEVMIDLSSVVFSPVDLGRIEIPRSMSRIEDQTLAYCAKYWNLINDTAFERTLLLYSRKYGKKNYDAFLAIRRGRLNNHRDDEILGAVMSTLVTGYYYSIRGDKYLQRQWNFIKLSIEQNAQALSGSTDQAPASSGSALRAAGSQARAKAARAKAKAKNVRAQSVRAQSAPAKTAGPRKKAAAGNSLTRGSKKKKKAPALAALKEKNTAAQERRESPDNSPETMVKKMNQENKKTRAALPALNSASQIKFRTPKSAAIPSAGGSVSDRLRELSGRSYDLYQDRFLAYARPAIRKVLGAGRGLFFKIPEEAEDLIYHFLKAHYADPYMNWKDSQERQALAAMGFNLESLIAIIDDCYRRF
ncbi:MAG: hypothetical protein LBP43_00810 [Treponema sp.]|jgi:hypothetical protein|nr:hypothetical protein [Treponema sp.]